MALVSQDLIDALIESDRVLTLQKQALMRRQFGLEDLIVNAKDSKDEERLDRLREMCDQ